MSSLSDRDIEDAAAEAGISPAELRQTLAARQGALVPTDDDAHAPVPVRGATMRVLKGNVSQPPAQAIRLLRTAFERQLGKSGHMQGDREADIVDDIDGVTTRLSAEDDGRGGSLVRVTIDSSHARARRAFMSFGGGAFAAAMFGLGVLLSSTLVVGAGIGIGVMTALYWFGKGIRERNALAEHAGAAATALVEADERAVAALPPARR